MKLLFLDNEWWWLKHIIQTKLTDFYLHVLEYRPNIAKQQQQDFQEFYYYFENEIKVHLIR